jgi:DnaJ family protein A protein 2
MFFGGGAGGSSRRRGPQKGEDINHAVKASLEDLYNGKNVRLAISRNKPCTDCDGRGGKVGAEKSCSDCQGRGVKISLRQIGPGMVQQMQATCSTCKGLGKSIDEKDKCKACKGNKVYKDKKVFDVNIEKGMVHGQKIKFSGEADEIPGTLPGDIIIVIQEKEHATFKRKGSDLYIPLELQLSEALCGFTKTITHLDGRILKIEVPQGTVTKHDLVRVISGEGMPTHGNIFVKGGLFIHFTVKFPKTLPPSVTKSIKALLPSPPAPELNGEEEECSMADADIARFGQTSDGRSALRDDEDDEARTGGKVQCGQN